jgi:hypothetical protein
MDALNAAESGDHSGLERLHDRYVNGVDFTAYLAVICTDFALPRSAEGWDRLVDDLAELSTRFGPALGNELRPCAHWPVVHRPGRWSPDQSSTGTAEQGQSPPMLVLSTTGDAATPVVNAETVAERTGAGLVLVDDTGHTAYGRSFCAQAIVADYLATGRVPTETHRC